MKYFSLFFLVVVKSIFAECCDCCKDCCPFFGKKDVNVVKKDVNIVKKDVNIVKKDVNIVKKSVNIVKKSVNILMLGLDDAGKTTILYQLKMKETVKTIPTLKFNFETIEYKNFKFTILDVGGKDKIRSSWIDYYKNTDGLIFVVDSNNKGRIDEAAGELKKLLEAEELKDCPVLVLANKQDLEGALPPGEVTKRLGMGEFNGRDWIVQGTSATTGQGLKEGLDWMDSVLLKKK